MLAAQAKERQKIYCGNQYDKKSGLPQNSAEQKGETREDIAKIAGVSNNFLRSNHFVYDDGQKCPSCGWNSYATNSA